MRFNWLYLEGWSLVNSQLMVIGQLCESAKATIEQPVLNLIQGSPELVVAS